MEPLKGQTPRPDQAEVIGLLLDAWDRSLALDPWLAFPQNLCSFSFGDDDRPLPIGALRLVWSADWPFRQACPACGHDAFIVSFGGLLSTGGAHLVCPSCSACWFQSMGGLGRVGRTMQQSPLAATEFRIRRGRLGGAFVSDGSELRAILHAREPYEPANGVSLVLDGVQRIGRTPDTAADSKGHARGASRGGIR